MTTGVFDGIVIGGGCTTDEPIIPGFRFNLHSNFYIGLENAPFLRDLELWRFGFSYVEPPVQQGATFRDGTCIVIHKDVERTCASLARFSRHDAEVREIRVKGGRAVGVELADGRRFAARRFVASAIDAPATMKLVGESAFPDEVRTKLNAWYWGSHSLLTIHLALSEPPLYSSAKFDPDIDRAFNLFMGWDDTEQVIRCFDQCRRNELPDHLMGNGACNTRFDPGYAPAGKHSAFWWPFAPYALPDGPEGWDRRRKEYTAQLLDVWRQYAPNLTDENVLASYLFTPCSAARTSCKK